MFEQDRDKREAWYHVRLILAKRVGIGTKKGDRQLTDLLKQHGSLQGVWESQAEMFSGGLDARIEEAIRETQFRTLTIHDQEYPQEMRDVSDTPPVLYVQGDTSLFTAQKRIAVVGTREPEEVDVREGTAVVKRLVESGYVIVSGLAKGCDTIGHRYAVENGGRTIAVLGTSLDQSYPAENKKLQGRIARDHLVVSQYPVGVRSYPSYFAHRNKVTVTLAPDGVTVIRAGDKSGTQHAIRECIAQRHHLYVLHNNHGKGYRWIDKQARALRAAGLEPRDYIKNPNHPERKRR